MAARTPFTPEPTAPSPNYPALAYLNFCPGGITAKEGANEWYDLASYSGITPTGQVQRPTRRRPATPDALVLKALAADDRLRKYSLLYGKDPSVPHYLPSLSVLAGAAFGRLTGVNASTVKKWADTMVLHYLDQSTETMPTAEADIYNVKEQSSTTVHETAATVLKRMLQESKAANAGAGNVGKPRPCGYVFKRGDIAWNCRTCQTDPTCVICDTCFHNSNHEGHEVYFHRTTPGGCCDCGDTEAWKIGGCCPLHRPAEEHLVGENENDPEEAVKMALRGQKEGLDTLQEPPTKLPPKFAAALGVVIGAAVHCLVDTVDGAGIGADPVQWNIRWADELSRILNGTVHDDECYMKSPTVSPQTILVGDEDHHHLFPTNYRLDLRLHNDDVHTFEEVIEALHEPRLRRNSEEHAQPLVSRREDASEMTHHVDADGQVRVKPYTSFTLAMQGYHQLKSKGLHCAVVTTAQVDSENRARALTSWLTEIATAHPSVAVLIVHALVQVGNHTIGGIPVWLEPRTIPIWASMVEGDDEITSCRRRFFAFPPNFESSYVTREEAEKLHMYAMQLSPAKFLEMTQADPSYYANVPYRLPPTRYKKSPHALWGTLPSKYADTINPANRHPLLYRIATGQYDATAATMSSRLTEEIYVVDTDIRKQQESELLLSSFYVHKIPGLHMISGVGTVRPNTISRERPSLPNVMEWRHLLAASSFRAPVSPIIWLLLLDPYPTKAVRSGLHALFLSLLVDSRFKCRFAAALGSIAYRPLSTLFCAGVGTEADTPLGFTVQIFTAGSLVRALANANASEKLLKSDQSDSEHEEGAPIGIFTLPIAHLVLRCIHTNLLGSTKEVSMIVKNTAASSAHDTVLDDADQKNDNLIPTLTYQPGEHPLSIQLPAATDDGFLDSRSTRHKRLPHLLRDLEYVMETPGTAFRLLLPQRFPVRNQQGMANQTETAQTFANVYSRLLRMAQGMDPQKRKTAGGHVEYEQQRWLEAFSLSLNFAGTRDALAESLTNACSAQLAPYGADGSHLHSIRDAMGNLFISLLRELKLWLYREGMLETGLPLPPTGGAPGGADSSQEALQRSTLHLSSSQLGDMMDSSESAAMGTSPTNSPTSVNGSQGAKNLALACQTGVKMTESQLELIESALRLDSAQRQHRLMGSGSLSETEAANSGVALGDWLRIPHSPLGGDALSFHLPLHRALAKSVRCICYVPVPETLRRAQPGNWWKLPIIDDEYSEASGDLTGLGYQHPLAALIRPVLKSSNCRVVWASGPDCFPPEAQQRRSRAKNVSANIASAKIIHSLADHPLRCISAAQQIERHLWARNGSSTAGMALNYSSSPLCRSFRDLDVTLIQLSASGFNIGLGAGRVFALLISRFSMDGYLCDPEKKMQGGGSSPGGSPYASSNSGWVNPPRLQDPDHAVALSESFFTTLCVLVTELPPPPPLSPDDKNALRNSLRRELLHALAAEPRSHSAAMEAATSASSRRDESAGISGGGTGGGALGDVFTGVLRQVGKQKTQASSRAATGPSAYELKAECCDEYDPTFFHLRRQEHQHAMDTVARLRKQKANGDKQAKAEGICFPLVCSPPQSHPRFLPCRLLLHLPTMDSAIRRYLLFAMTGGSWLPPPQPVVSPQEDMEMQESSEHLSNPISTPTPPNNSTMSNSETSVPVTMFSRRSFNRSSSAISRKSADGNDATPFSASVVAASSISILEVLQLLTLQVHTLEECAALHRMLPDLDNEAKQTSAGLSINSYLGRLIRVPESLMDEWAFQPYPRGPLPSKGSGENRGSILGMLVALYEHRSKQGTDEGAPGVAKSGGDDGHGGARSLAESGLQWLLRFVNALVDGATSVGAAARSASSGVPIRANGGPVSPEPDSTSWTIDPSVRGQIKRMLSNLVDLWPAEEKPAALDENSSMNAKNREARKAAQRRVMEKMKQKQKDFAATLAPGYSKSGYSKMDVDDEDETDLCIICRCDDTDGENNGPLGYLGHVQRSRYSQMRSTTEAKSNKLYRAYRVVGHRGCQLRRTEAMDSEALVCLPTGSVVTVLANTVSEKYDVLSRRVFVRHVTSDVSGNDQVTEGWASVQSSEGYVILSPLHNMCYHNTRWGSTRPIFRLCGHAAHLRCVETHTLSLHHKAAGEQPYDGRFAANIDDGEFLCPLCKQLSNILIPRDGCAWDEDASIEDETVSKDTQYDGSFLRSLDTYIHPRRAKFSEVGRTALRQFGDQLIHAMGVPWERASSAKKRKQQRWHKAIQRWDYDDDCMPEELSLGIKDVMSQLRQQLIAWAALGHSAGSAEAFARGVEEVNPFGTFSKTADPWMEFKPDSMDSHPMLLELRRALTATSGLYEVLLKDMSDYTSADRSKEDQRSSVGRCLADILDGNSWVVALTNSLDHDEKEKEILCLWSQLTALMCSMPCHVARDGMLSQRHEARAVAASMWSVRGLGIANVDHGKVLADEPPAPLAIRLIQSASVNSSVSIPPKWGFMDSFVVDEESSTSATPPFRLGVAAAFLYTPLLYWDLNTLAGAVFSTMIANASCEGTLASFHLVDAARALIVGRMLQVMITPNGFEAIPEEDEDQLMDYWTESEIQVEGAALGKLLSQCRGIVNSRSLDVKHGQPMDSDGDSEVSLSPAKLIGAIGRAILPLARSVVLLLRASISVNRQRSKRGKLAETKLSSENEFLVAMLNDKELMNYEDGFLILRTIGGPLPSRLYDATDASDWSSRIERWLVSAVGFERHHGSRGKNIITKVDPTKKFEDPDSSQLKSMKEKRKHQSSMEADPKHVMDDDEEMQEVVDEGNLQNELNDDMDDENDEIVLIDDIEMDNSEEEMVDFAEQQVTGTGSIDVGRNAPADNSDDNSDESCSTTAPKGPNQVDDRVFAGVSRSTIIPYQPSFLGHDEIGPGTRGTELEMKAASSFMCDLSHLGMIHRKDTPTKCLIRLPKSFVELYGLVNKVKGRDGFAAIDDNDDGGSSETAICLLTGAVMRSGAPRRSYNRAARPPGACTLHARQAGSGIGVFFLVQKCTVLLMHNNKSAYSPSLYVDQHGEEDPGLKRGRPLFLNEARYRALETLWRQQGIPREVAQIRSTSDRVIRDNWY